MLCCRSLSSLMVQGGFSNQKPEGQSDTRTCLYFLSELPQPTGRIVTSDNGTSAPVVPFVATWGPLSTLWWCRTLNILVEDVFWAPYRSRAPRLARWARKFRKPAVWSSDWPTYFGDSCLVGCGVSAIRAPRSGVPGSGRGMLGGFPAGPAEGEVTGECTGPCGPAVVCSAGRVSLLV